MAAVVTVLSWRFSASSVPLIFKVGQRAVEGRIGIYYSAQAHQELALRFSDGTLIALDPGASARVQRTDPQGATVSLESGSARVKVVPRSRALWQIAAGPYVVEVTGTAFRISWGPETRVLEIHMESGSVRVQGPGIESGVTVKESQHFTSQASAKLTQLGTWSARPGQEPQGIAATGARGEEPSPVRPAPTRLKVTDEPADAPANWTKLAAKSRYADIVRAAEERGINSVLLNASSEALVALADAARFSRKPEVARRALAAQRERFAGSAGAADAAFVLGRMDDDAGNAVTALVWYERYLAEAPSGHFVAEAYGRRMLALRKTGNRSESRVAAQEYLSRFPNGPYGSVAQELSAP
jgi:hypothetical protein